MALTMEWKANEAGDEATVVLAGRLDRETVPAARRRSLAVLKQSSPGSLKVDLGGVEDTDTAGLALLVEWCRLVASGGGGIQLTGVAEPIGRKIRLARLETLFAGLEQDRSAASESR